MNAQEVRICAECRWFYWDRFTRRLCDSPDAPVSDYVGGFKYCEDINPDGWCKYFKAKKVTPIEVFKPWWRRCLGL